MEKGRGGRVSNWDTSEVTVRLVFVVDNIKTEVTIKKRTLTEEALREKRVTE